DRYLDVRRRTEALVASIHPEDAGLQCEVDVSPPKWHLGHTTWVFEALALGALMPGFRPRNPRFAFLFNSYYEAVGDRQPRDRRRDLSRPLLDEILGWRRWVDEGVVALLEGSLGERPDVRA